jgi:hypothetical protein
MIQETHARLPQSCPYPSCKQHDEGLKIRRFARKGFYFRSSDYRRIPRFICLLCRRSFSSASFDPEKGQIRRDLNKKIQMQFVSGNCAHRRIALLLHTTRATIAKKLLFLGAQGKLTHRVFLSGLQTQVGLTPKKWTLDLSSQRLLKLDG